PTTIAAGQAAVELTFKAEPKAAIEVARLTIEGTAKVGDKASTRVAKLASPPGRVSRGDPALTSVLLAVALPTPFVIKGEYDMGFAPGAPWHQRKYKTGLTAFAGPIKVSLADRQARHLQGVIAPTITVPAGVTEFSYSVLLPPWMETGRTSR